MSTYEASLADREPLTQGARPMTIERTPMPACCFISCSAVAEWRIFTLRRTATGPGIAGPDIYSDETEACSQHVGDLLGWQPDAVAPEELYWEVEPLNVVAVDGADMLASTTEEDM